MCVVKYAPIRKSDQIEIRKWYKVFRQVIGFHARTHARTHAHMHTRTHARQLATIKNRRVNEYKTCATDQTFTQTGENVQAVEPECDVLPVTVNRHTWLCVAPR